MDEAQYQLGIRKLPAHQLVNLVIAYRNELKSCQELCKAFAQENFAQDIMHKVICGFKEAQLETMISDYERALTYYEPQAIRIKQEIED